MIHGRSASAYFYSPQLCGGGKLARKPQRTHDERRVNTFIGQRRMPDRIEGAGEYPTHPDSANNRADLEGKHRGKPEHHADSHNHPLREAPTIKRAHDRRRRKREECASDRERRNHVQDAHEKGSVQPRKRQEAQTAHDSEARTCLDGKSLSSVAREIHRRYNLQQHGFEEPGNQHGRYAYGKERSEMRARVEPQDPRPDVRLCCAAHAIFALRTCFFRNLEPISPPTSVPAANIAIMRRIQGSSVYWATIAATSAAS